jgi:hypothetical protein
MRNFKRVTYTLIEKIVFLIHGHKFYIKIEVFLLCFPFPCSSVSESFGPLDGRLDWIPDSGLMTIARKKGVFVDLSRISGDCTDKLPALPHPHMQFKRGLMWSLALFPLLVGDVGF